MASKALVLGGGGVTGVAWEIGLVAGLAEAGLDLITADRFIGTSAGAVVAVQLTSGVTVEALYQQQLAEVSAAETATRIGANVYASLAWSLLTNRDGEAFRRKIGAMALSAPTMPEAERRAVLAARIPVDASWPDQELLITAVRADTGEFVVWDRHSAVGLLDAVGASCAVPGVWPPVTVQGARYIDGGIRSATNADLAAGCERVVILAPVTAGGGAMPKLGDQVAALRVAGAEVVMISPDQGARVAIGRNPLDPARRAGAARAGREQAAAVLTQVGDVWR